MGKRRRKKDKERKEQKIERMTYMQTEHARHQAQKGLGTSKGPDKSKQQVWISCLAPCLSRSSLSSTHIQQETRAIA
jgi:hypothetical protein